MDAHLTRPDGVRIALDSSGDGPLAVYAHGMLFSRQVDDEVGLYDWKPVVDSGRHRLVRYDHRGHGASSGRAEPSDYGFGNLTEDLLALLDHLGTDQPVAAIGASMGAATVLTAAAAAPERFARLALLIPPTAWETRPAQADVYRRLADLAESAGTDAVGTAMAAAPVPAPLADVPGYPPPALGVAPDLLPSVLRGAAQSDLPPREQLARLPQPVLILAWADDPGHPVSTAQELARTLPHARLHVSENAADIRSWGKRVADFLDEG